MVKASLAEIARALGGEVAGAQVVAPGPGHGKRDRSLSVKLSASSPDGFLCHSFSGDHWRTCRDHVAGLLGLASDSWKREPGPPRERTPREPEPDNRAVALGLWRRRKPVEGTLAETYLRRTRGYAGMTPATSLARSRRRPSPTRDRDCDPGMAGGPSAILVRNIDGLSRVSGAVHNAVHIPGARVAVSPWIGDRCAWRIGDRCASFQFAAVTGVGAVTLSSASTVSPLCHCQPRVSSGRMPARSRRVR